MTLALVIALGVWLGGTALIGTALFVVAVEQRVVNGRWRWPR